MSGHGNEKSFVQSAFGGIVIITLTVVICGGIFIMMLANGAAHH
jgi:hypothetical protein